MAVRITAYLDGATVGCGYKFIVTKDPYSWRAYRTNRGLKRFLTLFGLSIDPAQTELHDYRDIGRGRCITMVCTSSLFWRIEDVPEAAKEYFDCSLLHPGRRAYCDDIQTESQFGILPANRLLVL